MTNRKHSFQYSKTIETDISDYHRRVFTMFKTKFVKLPPKRFIYRFYKNFNKDVFLSELGKNLSCHTTSFTNFINIFTNLLNFHAPLKTKIFRGNNMFQKTSEKPLCVALASRISHKA